MNILNEVKNKPNKITINILEDALKRAKKGDIQSVVIFGSDSEGYTFNQMNISSYAMQLLGELRLLERDIVDIYCDIRKDISWDYVNE